MSDRQFIRQLLLAYLVKKAAEAESPPAEAPSKGRGFGWTDALLIGTPAMAGGSLGTLLGLQDARGLVRSALARQESRLGKHQANLMKRIFQKHLGLEDLLGHDWRSIRREFASNPAMRAEYLRKAVPISHSLYTSLLKHLVRRPGLTTSLMGLTGALGGAGLGAGADALIRYLTSND